MIADCSYAFRDRYARKACAIIERRSADCFYGIGNSKACIFLSYSILNKSFPVFCIEISVYILICSIIFIYCYDSKACAIIERRRTDFSYAFRYRYASKACAITERRIADFSYAFRDRYASKACAISERIIADCSYAFRYRYASKAEAITERIRVDFRYAFGYRYASKACAIIERISPIVVTPSGIVMLARLVQLENAPLPIVVTR